ncbi:hypothetical protein [Xenorhabdus bovienii]|uniref:Uncharacterized protein n=2 Tax=Xenorhabdus bovienii TaxID=40576 RepID=A0A077PZJ6_XENBV|nr:hypothetical protein [Xenorhabdus bovienii]CDH01591.1 conserved hypothetical protein [Xenorhabdus bovienii str. feltiae Moldova]CDH25214.1 conserved hypothetical protein [Xenorhabdus bovienii str. kraussei Becker Underwood]
MDTELERIESNEKKLWEKFKSVTPLKFSLFLKDKGIVTASCLMCGNTDIRFPSMADAPKEEFFLIPIEVNELVSKSKYYIANYEYRGICPDCGYEIYFNAYPVINWIENSDKQGREDKNG